MGSIPGWGTSPGEGNGKFLLVGRIYLLINVLCVCVCVCVCVCAESLSRVRLSGTPWTVAH